MSDLDLNLKNNQAVHDTQSLADIAQLPSLQTSTQANLQVVMPSVDPVAAMTQGQVLSEAVASTVSADNVHRIQQLQADLSAAQVVNTIERSPSLEPGPSHMYSNYWKNQMMPFVTRDVHKRKFARSEEEELNEELNEERGDLLKAELDQHALQLGMAPGKSMQKGVAGKISRGNVSILLHDKLVSMLDVFPWFFNFIKGVVLMRTTKQD